MQTARPGEWVDAGLGLSDIDFDQYPMRIGTDRYYSREIAQAEHDRLWTRVWQVAGREDELGEPGAWKEYRLGDQSYVIVRGHDGGIAGYVNACRHRGNKILTGGRGSCSPAGRIVCPYHMWSYGLDGRLSRVSRPDLVGPIDKDEHGLLPVSVDRFAGFIFLNPDPDAAPLLDYLGEVAALLDPYHLEEMVPVLDVRESLDCNWKVVVDAFAEGYHVDSIHPELTRVVYIDSKKEKFGFFGDHFVVAVPFEVANVDGFGPAQQVEGIRELPGTFPGVADVIPRFDELVKSYRDQDGTLALPGTVTPRTLLQKATRETWTAKGLDVSGLTDAQMSDNHAWQLFPNFFATIRAGEATVIVAVPHPDGDPNRCIWHVLGYMWLPPEQREAARVPITEVDVPGSYEYFLALQQDYEQMPRQQLGLRNRRLEHLSLARHEIRIAHFHRSVDRHLAAGDRRTTTTG
ncbi:MAG TPA: aromatic ring-hydroxylating dioxygenase subunit alpha [Acidimicrobiales bacterium]|nr:aromatic ring-hydroxylating dioxygenase subunit alpha [Acidimicrobiales bacterium]